MNWEQIEGMWHTKYYGPCHRIKFHQVKHEHAGDMSFWSLEILSDQGWRQLHSIAKRECNESTAITRLQEYTHKLYV